MEHQIEREGEKKKERERERKKERYMSGPITQGCLYLTIIFQSASSLREWDVLIFLCSSSTKTKSDPQKSK